MTEPLSAALAARVKLVILDVDGVLTDGGILMGSTPAGELLELKRFEITDGLGMKLMQRAGLHVYMVSGRRSGANQVRADELGVEYREAHGGFKLPVVNELRARHDVEWSAVCCICDDLADLPLMQRAGLPVAVANAVPEVKQSAAWLTRRAGGAGAVRELAEALLQARGEWLPVLAEYLRERNETEAGRA